MQLKPSLTAAISRLTAYNVPSPRLNAEILLMFVLNRDRAYLYAHPDRELTSDETARYEAALAERSRGVPAQYITGHQEFWGLDFIVTPAVLIPRPETEHVIEAVLGLRNNGVSSRPSALSRSTTGSAGNMPLVTVPKPEVRDPRSDTVFRIVDVGTGSGCIAIALASELPQAEIHATEISSAALEISRANAARHQLETCVTFHETDLLAGLAADAFDFVVSNPPYVGESEEDQVQLEVRKFEPRNAVFAGPTGLEVIARLIPQAHAALRPGSWLVMEISGSIAHEVTRLLHDWEEVHLLPDLQSIPRVALARKPML